MSNPEIKASRWTMNQFRFGEDTSTRLRRFFFEAGEPDFRTVHTGNFGGWLASSATTLDSLELRQYISDHYQQSCIRPEICPG